ncbi:putative PHD finger and JmjC domain protein [Talaromyces proteolyticus]|uniref:JmjC domain-containing histone demethylation protein 1 n=1 Tax=Talaromyces proteolyticus TaxID=1131652 RepID=A0AAD4L2F9_9EURO|nr:putative PHD finger and JmjC domain protein [Talaromyces proteolyticus]KAH8704738.1 putative PHD finger and JmjC domain protein [Talaromyces proteolyticus]
MANTSSYLGHPDGRPDKYRTPSPPRRAVEPISPSLDHSFQVPWNERSAFRPSSLDRASYGQGIQGSRGSIGVNQRHASLEKRGNHPKPGHGHHRTNSSIETLANIALATSPTFPSLPYELSQNTAGAGSPPLFPSAESELERPTKRARSERAMSPTSQRVETRPYTSHVSVPDSMKTDAELLLNFARPSNFPTTHRYPQSINGFTQPYQHFPIDQKWPIHNDASLKFQDTSIPWLSRNPHSPSRLRSHSDGSAAIARPVIHGMRPNTSSSTLPAVTWESDQPPQIDAFSSYKLSEEHNAGIPRPQGLPSSIDGKSMDTLLEAKEEDGKSDESTPASCAACHLVRMGVNGEDQGEDTWINCDGCERWFHIVCAGFKNDREVRTVDKFICRNCRPVHGQTTFVRKSSRARTAIDYAGLNQGLVKTSTDSHEHHYIQPIKDGKIEFLPESFPRMRAELVTAEFFERGVGMTEPIIIPAALNPRTLPDTTDEKADFDQLLSEAQTQEMFDDLLDNYPGESEVVIDCGQDVLDMVVPQGLTVRTVAQLYGPEERVEVIDVKSQQGEDKRWNMQKWADYYESTGAKVVRNVISLEVSQSQLGRLIRRPKIVRDLDLQDAVWPEELKAIGDYPKVQFYCLMSVADCYTDFHIDFGGSSVYYTILKGKKTFFFIPPKEKHLKKYEEWCNSPAQDTTFLGEQTKECYRVDLEEGDTMLIPAGWIHAVWTPENSLVIGGNFLTRMNYGMQIKVAKIEKDTKVPRKFRYPFFQKIQWYTALKYLNDDPISEPVLDAFSRNENYRFYRQFPIYYEFEERQNRAAPGDAYYNARFYSQAELEGLPQLLSYLLRTALIAGNYCVDGVTMEARNAIRRSIPKMQGDPVDVVKKFAVWIAWKRGNETAPNWIHPGVISINFKIEQAEKRPAGRPSRRSERHADAQKMYAERQSLQLVPDLPLETQSTAGPVSQLPENNIPVPQQTPVAVPAVKEEASKPRNPNKGSGLGPKRVACDACRKRRIRCRHKDEQTESIAITSPEKPITTNMFDAVDPYRQSILAHDAASVLNALASGALKSNVHENGNNLTLDHIDGYSRNNVNVTMMGMPPVSFSRPMDTSPNGVGSAKKGRSKACDECRKSKRRCIHDEYGRIDPVKAQERAKPRATPSAKRPRPNDDGLTPIIYKRPKPDAPFVPSDAYHPGLEGNQLMPSGFALPSGHDLYRHEHEDLSNAHSPPEEKLEQHQAKDVPTEHVSYASPPAVKTDGDTETLVSGQRQSTHPTNPLVSPPTSLVGEVEVSLGHANEELHGSLEGDMELLYTPTSSSRHSSRQPRQIDRYMPDQIPTKPTVPRQGSRQTSSGATKIPTKPSSAPSSTAKKPLSRPTSSHKKSASPAVEKKLTSSPSTTKMVKRERNSFTTDDADPDSLRLIREIQEQEFGLRRRQARVL